MGERGGARREGGEGRGQNLALPLREDCKGGRPHTFEWAEEEEEEEEGGRGGILISGI